MAGSDKRFPPPTACNLVKLKNPIKQVPHHGFTISIPEVSPSHQVRPEVFLGQMNIVALAVELQSILFTYMALTEACQRCRLGRSSTLLLGGEFGFDADEGPSNMVAGVRVFGKRVCVPRIAITGKWL